jgi:hypothetical protein
MWKRDRDKRGRAAQDAGQADEVYLRDIGYQPNVNQVRHEPVPASAQPSEESGVEQRPGPDTEGLAERWRVSHEEWRRKMRSQNG